jgi:hypothetical protein
MTSAVTGALHGVGAVAGSLPFRGRHVGLGSVGLWFRDGHIGLGIGRRRAAVVDDAVSQAHSAALVGGASAGRGFPGGRNFGKRRPTWRYSVDSTPRYGWAGR